MTILSHLRKSRQQAKEHSAKLVEQKKKDSQAVVVPYKHIPTHAASDAIACAPPAWREAADRPRIVEHNRRRSAMAAAGFSMSMPSTTNVPPLPSLSTSQFFTYFNGDATPYINIPHAQSYTNIHSASRGRESRYSTPDAVRSQSSSWRGKEANRYSLSAYDSSIPSSAVGSKDSTPVGSSRASNSSRDELEMAANASYSQTPQGPHMQGQQLQSYHQAQKLQQLQQLQQTQQNQRGHQQYQQLQPTQPVKREHGYFQQPQQMQPEQTRLRSYQPAHVEPLGSQLSMPPPPTQPKHHTQQLADAATAHQGYNMGGAHRLHPSRRSNSSESWNRSAMPTTSRPGTRDARPPHKSKGSFGSILNPSDNIANTTPKRSDMSYSASAPKSAMISVPPRAVCNQIDPNCASPGFDLSAAEDSQQQQPSNGQTQYQSQTDQRYDLPQTQQQADMEPIVSTMEPVPTRPTVQTMEPVHSRYHGSQLASSLATQNLVNILPEPAYDDDLRCSREKVSKVSKRKKNSWLFSRSAPITA